MMTDSIDQQVKDLSAQLVVLRASVDVHLDAHSEERARIQQRKEEWTDRIGYFVMGAALVAAIWASWYIIEGARVAFGIP